MKLYLMRHGVAVPPGTDGMPDHERPLTPAGREKARQIALGLSRLGVAPGRIVTSPLQRARETAEIVASILRRGGVLELSDALDVARDASGIACWLESAWGPGTDDELMLVGHNPGLSELIGLLLSGGELGEGLRLRKGGVAALERLSAGGYVLDWMARPRLLRRVR